MKKIITIVCSVFLWSCPAYDPSVGSIAIRNYSDSAVYVYATCLNYLPCEPKLVLVQNFTGNAFDEKGNKIEDTIIYPNYRINAYSFGSIGVWGSPKKPRLPCDNKEIKLYFIKEAIIRTKEWKEICNKQLYENKMTLSEEKLNASGWKIIYKP